MLTPTLTPNRTQKVEKFSKTNGILDMKHNHYTMSSTEIAWQTDLFIQIASDWQHNHYNRSCCRQKISGKI